MKIRFNQLIYDLPNKKYHGATGTYSSSQLKDIIDDEELFFQKYIAKTIPRTSNSAFEVGTYFHTGVLEPDKVEHECAVYTGPIRRGADYDAFMAKHGHKCVVTSKEKATADRLISVVQGSPVAMTLLSTAKPEVSLFVKIYVCGRFIFAKNARGHWHALNMLGWQFAEGNAGFDTLIQSGEAVPLVIKVRADALDTDGRFIVDLKSTSGNAKNDRTVRQKISAFNYDLSAALYLDIFSLAFDRPVSAFYWTFASKDYNNTRTWAASADNLLIGRAKWSAGVCKLAAGIKKNWDFEDTLGIAEPEFYQREWLEPRDTHHTQRNKDK